MNLLVGRNNAGKSTVLEALFLMGGATNPIIPSVAGQMRGQWPIAGDTAWRTWFYAMDPKNEILIGVSTDREQNRRQLEIEAFNVRSFAASSDSGLSTGLDGRGAGTITQGSGIGGIRLRCHPATGRPITGTATLDPKTGVIQAEAQEREDFVRTVYLPARTYSSGGRRSSSADWCEASRKRKSSRP